MYRYRDPLTHATVTMHMTAQAVQDHIFALQKRHSAFRTWAIPHKATSLRSVLFSYTKQSITILITGGTLLYIPKGLCYSALRLIELV